MRKIKLGDVLDVKRGASLSGDFYSEQGERIRLTLGNFKYPGGGFKENTSKKDIYFTGAIKPEFILKKGDIITPLTEQVSGLLGETARIPEDDRYIQSGDIGLVIPDKSALDKDFAYYLVSSPVVKKQLDAAAQQTKIRHTSPDAIKACEAYLPELLEQKKIAALLDAINEKIGNNNAICADLEGMAKLLYDYWFVQFDFPDENGKPYKSSGGKMVWNEELKREIPEGWAAYRLDKLATIQTETVSPFAEKTTVFEHYSIPAFDDGHYPAFDYGSMIDSNKYKVPPQSILVSKLNPQFKRIWDPLCISNNCICSTEFMPFVCKNNNYRGYIYFLLNSDSFQKYLIQCSSCSTGSRKRMQPELCGSFMFAMPADYSVVDEFSRIIAPILDIIKNNVIENHDLVSLRDFLLPMLMNGQVKVKGA